MIHQYITARGFAVARRATFGLDGDPKMNRVGVRTISDAAARLVAGDGHDDVGAVDALFISCTGLATCSLIDPLEQRLGIPVVTSNEAQAWQLLCRAGRTDAYTGFGKLLTLTS